MRDYNSIRDEWIHLRKIQKNKKHEIDYIKQSILGLIVDKTIKLAKADYSADFDKYLLTAIKSEHKQTLDAVKQGVKDKERLSILESLLPNVLSEEETSDAITAVLSKFEKPNMGLVMKELKKIDSIDMKLASKLVKELI